MASEVVGKLSIRIRVCLQAYRKSENGSGFSRWGSLVANQLQRRGFAPHVAARDGECASPLLVLVGRFSFPLGSIRFILLLPPFCISDAAELPLQAVQSSQVLLSLLYILCFIEVSTGSEFHYSPLHCTRQKTARRRT